MSVKEQALQILDNLPNNITWKEIIYTMYVRQKIQEGIEAIEAGDVLSQNEAKKIIMEGLG